MISGSSAFALSQSQSYYNLAPVSPLRQGAPLSTAQALDQGSLTLTGTDKEVTRQFLVARLNVPSVDLTLSSPLNAMKAQDTAAVLDAGWHSTAFDYKLQFGDRYLTDQGRQLNDIYNTLSTLRVNAGTLQNSSVYNIKSAQSADTAVATASAGQNTPVGRYAVTVTRLARADQLVSNTYADANAALGLSGTFKVNGWQSTITATDSLVSIRDKINYGEDTNHNGTLDVSADINGNGTLQTLVAPGTWDGRQYLPSFYWNENRAGGGTLSPSEDTNSNKRLDGTSAQTGVIATVVAGSLLLTSTNGGDVNIRMDDPNRILESLGYISRNPDTGAVVTNYTNTGSALPQTAEFSVNGHSSTSASNTVTNGAGGLVLFLAGTGSTTVEVTADPANALAPIKAFANSYNQSLDLLNTTIYSGGGLAGNTRLQEIYTDTVRSFFTPPPEPVGSFSSLADIGIGIQNEPHRISQLSLDQLPSMQNQGTLPGVGPQSLLSETRHVNVNGANDFKITLDAATMGQELTSNNGGVKDIMALAAERLQQKLDRHLQPEYGTIKLQQQVMAYYAGNQAAVGNLMAQSTQVLSTEINHRRYNMLFTPITAQKNIFSAVV